MTPPPPAMAIRGSASACSRSNLSGFKCSRASAPTISRWLSSSVPMSMRRSLRSGSSQFSPWIEYCIAAASSPLAELFEQHVAELRIRHVSLPYQLVEARHAESARTAWSFGLPTEGSSTLAYGPSRANAPAKRSPFRCPPEKCCPPFRILVSRPWRSQRTFQALA